MNRESIDTTNMCSHLQKKLFEEDGLYHGIWVAMQDDPELTAVVTPASFTSTGTGRRYWYWPERQRQRSAGKIDYVICCQSNL